MITLDVEKRDMAVKAKKLRREGLIPCNVCGKSLKENMVFTATEGDINKLMRTNADGSVVMLKCGEEQHSVLIKEIESNGPKVENITFLYLEKDTMVSSTAKIMLKNKDKVTTMVQLLIEEIPYDALPKNIVETIEIDLAELPTGTKLKVGDLAIAKTEGVAVKMDLDETVLTIAGQYKQQEEEPVKAE